MIIDCHGHVSPPPELGAFKSSIISHRGEHGRRMPPVSDEDILFYANKKEMAPCGHLDMLDRVKTDIQLISPRPFQMMHSFKPGRLVHWYTEETNNLIARTVQLLPQRFFGIAGLPQVAGDPIEKVLPELERAVKTLGFSTSASESSTTELRMVMMVCFLMGFPFSPAYPHPRG
jgi:4-oxalmesaconate hydratase